MTDLYHVANNITHTFQRGTKLFIRWASRNRKHFGRAPYLLRQGNGRFFMGFRGVDKHIECRFSEGGLIEVRVCWRRDFHDIVTEYDLYEEKTPDGRWLCRMCRDWPNPDKGEPCRIYEDRAALWIDHSFAPLATWTREFFTPEARLCLCRYRGCTSAFVAKGKRLKEIGKRRDCFKRLPVLTGRSRK